MIFPILPRSDTLEEEEAVQQNMDEIQVLVEADAVLLDDEQLGTTIYESLMQVQASPEKIIQFAIDVINNRLKGAIRVPQPPLVVTPDLQQLSKRGWIAVTNIVAGTIAHGIEVSKASNEHKHWQWFGDAIRLLLSKSQYPLTENACNILIRSVRKDTFDQFLNALIFLSATSDRATTVLRLHNILGRLSTRLCELLRSHQLNHEQVIKFVLHTTPLETGYMIAGPLRSTLNLRLSSPSVWAFAQDTVGNVILEHANLPTQEDRRIGPWLQDAIHILLSTSQYLLTPTAVKALARWIRAGPAVDGRRTSLQFNVVRFCWVVVQLHAELENQWDFEPNWQRFYMQCAKAMRWFRENRYPLLPKQERQETRRLAKQCLDHLISVGLADLDLEQDHSLAELDTLLPDDIFREVVMFSPFDRADSDDAENDENGNALSSIDDDGLIGALKNFVDIFEEPEWREMIAT
ncbi:hypothetical protein EIP86_001176 [Pleurotus ostreatoroseus]|nr:hypothetical protein EIP86_001176 [Pleurotus ostreatoroseus]